jgi:predicted Zn-dependent peptidase
VPVVHRVLPNGVTVLVDPVGHVQSASIGIWCRVGSVHEPAERAGIAHFAEHMLFKGTARRSALEIAEAVEGRGGVLNAFTDKLQTCYYARCLADEAEGAFDVLADMVGSSRLAAEDVETERKVILEEIRRGEDEPGDLVHDLHLEQLWPDHPLGRPVIGSPETVGSTSQSELQAFVGGEYQGPNLLVSVAGNVDPAQAARWAEEAFSEASPVVGREDKQAGPTRAGTQYVVQDVEQVHFCIGGPGVDAHDPRLHTQIVMDNVLGSGMSSRLFQEVREKRGLAYAIGSYGLAFPDAGCLTVYGGTSQGTWGQVQEVVDSELAKFCAEGPTDGELERAKRMVAGSLALGLESMQGRMMRMARNEITYGREIPLEETLAKVEAVTGPQIVELARELLDPGRRQTTAIGPG